MTGNKTKADQKADQKADKATAPSGKPPKEEAEREGEKEKEIGGSKGPEPTRYGDWEQKGRCTDF